MCTQLQEEPETLTERGPSPNPIPNPNPNLSWSCSSLFSPLVFLSLFGAAVVHSRTGLSDCSRCHSSLRGVSYWFPFPISLKGLSRFHALLCSLSCLLLCAPSFFLFIFHTD